jgi:hypothetical protein
VLQSSAADPQVRRQYFKCDTRVTKEASFLAIIASFRVKQISRKGTIHYSNDGLIMQRR